MRRILVAEDARTQAEHLRLILETEGFEVACVDDGADALAMAAQQRFDLVLTDVEMTGALDGVGLLHALRADPVQKGVPVMLLSANGGADARAEGFAAGADDYIVKPFGARELLARVEAAIRSSGLKRDVATRDELLEAAGRQANLHRALDAAEMGELTFHHMTGAVSHTRGFAALFGHPADKKMSVEDIRAGYHPEDRARIDAYREEVQFGTGALFEIEHRVLWPVGTVRWLAGRGAFTRDEAGVPRAVTAVYWDVTPRKLGEARQQLLLDELNHRVKNTIATVQSIAMQTRRNAESLGDFEEAFQARLLALAGAHDLLTQVSWDGASLGDLVTRTLAPHRAAGTAETPRLTLGGPVVRLSANAAITLHMAFHELATNACKYGALSVKDGRLAVTWTIDRAADPAAVMLSWIESGGPPVAPPGSRGFGSRLIEQGLTWELGAEVGLDFHPEGLRCAIRLPLSRKVAAGGPSMD